MANSLGLLCRGSRRSPPAGYPFIPQGLVSTHIRQAWDWLRANYLEVIFTVLALAVLAACAYFK